MTGNLRLLRAWLLRTLFSLPKWWKHDYRSFRVIVEQEDGHLRYFSIPACLQRAAARSAIAVFATACFSFAALGAFGLLLGADNSRMERSMRGIYSTLLGDSLSGGEKFAETELLKMVRDAKDRQDAIQLYLGFTATAFKEENQNLMGRLRDTGLTGKAIQAIEQASVGGGQLGEGGSQKPLHSLLPEPLVKDILKNRELHEILRALPDQMPLRQFEVSSEFGIRKHPISGAVHFHTGVDLVGLGEDNNVYPAKAGHVISATMHPQLGNTVVIQHSNGIRTLYAHLGKIFVKDGDSVQLATPVGTVGNTGASSTGTHLHFEVLVGGFTTNPIKVIRAARNVQQIQ